jgi:hypothetical protein
MCECLGILGILIFLGLYTRLNKRNTILPKLICISWIIQSFKLYLEDSHFYRINIISSVFGMLIGALLVVNIFDILNVKATGLLNTFKVIYNLIFFNYSYGVYNIDKLFNGVDNQTTLYVCLNYCFIALNTFPLLSNTFIQKNLFNLPITLYPSPITLSTLTIFLNYFRDTLPIHTNYVFAVDLLCYMFLIISFLNDILFLKVFTKEHIFYLVLNILNLVFIYYLDIFGLQRSLGIILLT